MYKSLFISSGFHLVIILLGIFTLPFIAKEPLNIPPLVSVELIQIAEKTNIPYAPKAKKIIEKVKKKNEKLLSDQAPPKKIKNEKNKKVNLDKKKKNIDVASKKTPTPDNKKKIIKKEKLEAIPMPDKKKEKLEIEEEKKQKPSKNKINKEKIAKTTKTQEQPTIEDKEVKQVSEYEKKELFDPNKIATLIDKSKEDWGETNKKNDKISQSQNLSMTNATLTLSEEDALKAQIFGCWSIPLGLPYKENLLVRIKLKLKPDGTLIKTEIIDHARMNTPGQGFYKVLAESALRAIRLCQPLKVPTSGYERWKDLQLNFDPRKMLGGG